MTPAEHLLSFMRQLESSPQDADLRDVYADFLEENNLLQEATKQRQLAQILRYPYGARVAFHVDYPSYREHQQILDPVYKKQLHQELINFVISNTSDGAWRIEIGPD